MHDRADALARDAANPLAAIRSQFVIDDPEVIYLDGNSLGRLPRRTADAMADVVRAQWGGELIRGWDHWIDLPSRIGDAIAAHVVGARPGEVVVSDSTTVNLYKLVHAALRMRPGHVVASTDDFPTDRYIVSSVAQAHGREVRWIDPDVIDGVQPHEVAAVIDGAALVLLSHVQYRSGALADLAAITALAHDHGALMLWDCSHSGGSVPIGLAAHGVDLAVGCTYKYLNSGPGAPAWLYVAGALQAEVSQPIQGWMGAADVFAMGPDYERGPGVRGFLAGSPPVLALISVANGVAVTAEAGIDTIRAVSMDLTDYFIALVDDVLAPLGFELGTPRDRHRRGGHVSIRHRRAAELDARLRGRKVIGDFRHPDSLRLGLAALTTSFDDCWRAVEAIAEEAEVLT